MKHIKLLTLLALSLMPLSKCSENKGQPQPAESTSWWQRSKNYAASWVPQSVKDTSGALYRYSGALNPIRIMNFRYQRSFVVKRLEQIIDTKIKNQQADVMIEINDLTEQIVIRAAKISYDPKDLLNQAVKYIEDKAKHDFSIATRSLYNNIDVHDKNSMSNMRSESERLGKSFGQKLKTIKELEKQMIEKLMKIK